jgi:plastocyanin
MAATALAIAAVGAATAPLPARAVAPPAAPVATVVTEQYRFIPGDTTGTVPVAVPLRVQQGGRLFLANVDPSAPHTVTEVVGAGQTPRFDTGREVSFGEAVEVAGVASLPAGTYPFFCSLHTWLMQGELVVEPAS